MIRRRKKKALSSPPPQGLPAVKIESKVLPAHILEVHRSIAERMGTGFMVCENCNRVQDLRPDLVQVYMSEGWPVCCPGTPNGGTMRYCRAEERKRV